MPIPSGVDEIEPRQTEKTRDCEGAADGHSTELPKRQTRECLSFVGVNVFVDLHFKGHDYASPVTFFAIFVAEKRMKMRTTGATKNMPKLLPMNSQRSWSPGLRLSPVHDPMSA